MSQSNQSEQFKRLKQHVEEKDFDNFNRFLDNNEISKKTLNSILCYTLQNYISNYEMMDYIQLLIEKGADQNAMFHNKSSNQGPRIDEKDNVSILMYACIYADIRLIESIATEKNINLRDKNGKNALFYVLSDKGDNSNAIDALLYHNIDVNCVAKVDMGDKTFENHTALSLAASKNMIQSFKILINKGSDPNFKIIQTGDTILHIAVKKGNLEMVKLLLDTNKIKFEEKNKENKTALELAKEINDKSIYNLIKEKIEEGNRQGDIIAKELLTEEKNNLNKKQNEIKSMNLLNEFNKANQKSNEKNNVKKNVEIKEKFLEKRQYNKMKIFNKYLRSNIHSTANLEINFSFPKEQFNSDKFINSEQNKENIPILTIDLFSNEFNEYKEYYNKKKNEEDEKKRMLEEENLMLKKNMEIISENNKILSQKLKEKEFQIKDMEIKHQIEINELKNKISFLEKENDNDKVIISDLNKQININMQEKTKNNEKEINININDINNKNDISNSEIINYLDKKFINYNYNLDFLQDKEKNNYVINCLSKDLIDFEKFVSVHIKEDTNIYQELLKNIEKAVNESIPDYQVHLYGSHATNLCLPWSDLDVVLLPKKTNITKKENNHALLYKLYENLKSQKWVKEINYISNASIPIIKIYSIEVYNNIPIDISIQEENHFGLKCVELVKLYMNQYESLKPLVLSIKNILKRANLNDPYKGGISSYGLILMIIFFLKQQSFSGIDISLGENNSNLGFLFFNFLQFYSFEFEFGKNIIYIKDTMNDLDDLKYQNISLGSRLIIIDPLNPNNNVAKSCYQSMGIKMAFIISLKSLYEDCECGCHYSDDNKEYNNTSVEHCFLKRIFNAVKRYTLN